MMDIVISLLYDFKAKDFLENSCFDYNKKIMKNFVNLIRQIFEIDKYINI